MSWSKRQIIEQAFNEIGLAGYVFDLSPEQLQTAARQLDSMMLTWDAKGIRLGYPFAASPQDIDIDQDTNLPTAANEAVYLNLSLRIGPGFGKAVPPDTKTNAKLAYDAVIGIAAMPRERQFPGTMPAGAGNKPWRTFDDAFLRGPDENPLNVESNGQLDFVGD